MPQVARPAPVARPRWSRQLALPRTWAGLLASAAGCVAVASALTQVAGRFFGPSLAVLMILTGTGAWLTGRQARTAAWLIGISCLLNLVLHAEMLALVLRGPAQGLAIVLDAVHAVGSVVAVIASAAVLLTRTQGSSVPARVAFVGLGIVAATAAVTTASYLNRTSAVPAEGEAVLSHSGMAVGPTDVVVTADEDAATLVVRNDDWLYRRSFDIDELEVHEVIPPRTAVRIELPPVPETYEFYDFITFTPATEGTVVVRGH